MILCNLQKALAAEWYIDPTIYERERRSIFEPAWWLIGPVHSVANPGDYISDTICGWPVFAIRSDDLDLRAFLNVCRHRGSTLLEPGIGRTKSIRCPYHGWLYDDQGKFLNAPKFGCDLKDYSKELSLQPIGVHIWKELVFVKVNPDVGPSFDEWLGDVARLSDDFPSPADHEYRGEFTVSGSFNWKAYCDNTVEGYHLNLVHPRLGKAVAGGQISLRSVNDGHSVVFDVNHSESGGAKELRGQKGMWIYHFPGLQLVLGDRVFKAERVDSDDANHLRSRNWAWYSGLTEDEREDAFQWARQIVEEDFGICAKVVKNMRAGVFKPGPLSPKMENHVARFQQIIRENLNGK